MLDRNGTNATLAALELVTSPIRASIIGAQAPLHLEGPSPVTFDCTPRGYPRDYFDVLPADTDVLVLPRRYAGLSMPVQEAAARGVPTVMTDVLPQSRWPGVYKVPSRGKQGVVMAGGKVDVHDPDPRGIARAIDGIAGDPVLARRLSDQAYEWAQRLSWDVWKPRYEARLRGDG
jgi:glycosyltransferase involved in cell wall biosynthesis